MAGSFLAGVATVEVLDKKCVVKIIQDVFASFCGKKRGARLGALVGAWRFYTRFLAL